jgi:hypothetical protein
LKLRRELRREGAQMSLAGYSLAVNIFGVGPLNIAAEKTNCGEMGWGEGKGQAAYSVDSFEEGKLSLTARKETKAIQDSLVSTRTLIE